MIVTTLIRMAGALIWGFVVQGLLGLGGGGFMWSIVVATVGAIILLAIYRLISASAAPRFPSSKEMETSRGQELTGYANEIRRLEHEHG